MKIFLMLVLVLTIGSCIVMERTSHEGFIEDQTEQWIITVQPYDMVTDLDKKEEDAVRLTLPDLYLDIDTIKIMNDLIILTDNPTGHTNHREGYLTYLDTMHIFNPSDYTETIKFSEQKIPVIINFQPTEN